MTWERLNLLYYVPDWTIGVLEVHVNEKEEKLEEIG